MKAFAKIASLTGAALLALTLMPTMAPAQEFSDLQNNGNLHLRGYGTFFIEGNTHFINADTARGGFPGQPGLSMINQMHVMYLLPQAKKGKKHNSILMVHGCCLSTKSWQTTPDGRMGWDEYFVRQGFDTYLADQVARARSGADATAYNKVRTGQITCTPDGTVGPGGNAVTCQELPAILIASDQFAWNGFRWGTTTCSASPCSTTTTPHPNLAFPVETIGVGPGANLQFFNMVIPDFNGTLSLGYMPPCASALCNPPDAGAPFNSPIQMARLASKVGGMILMAHSQSSSFPTRTALQPESGCFPWTSEEACKVEGIIQIETGCFGNLTEDQIDTLKHIPILVVDGDFYSSPRPPQSCVDMMDDINGAGGDMSYAHLPNLTPDSIYPGSPGPMPGIEHMMMVGTKNLEVADFLIGWIESRDL